MNKNEQPCKSCGVPIFTANCWLVCPFKKYEEKKYEEGKK